MSQVTPDEFNRFLRGYNVTDCAVREHDLFYFIGREDYTKWPASKWDAENEPPPGEDEVKKILLTFDAAAAIGKRVGRVILNGYTRTMAGASQQPDAKGYAVSSQGLVYALGGGVTSREGDISPYEDGGPGRGAVRKLRTIEGWLYFAGGNNSVGKRLGKDSWLSHSHSIPDPVRADGRANVLFDIDGFSQDDLYTVGNYGQVFHFDGTAWKRVSLPTNIDFETVCCAGDGHVYISGAKGTTYRGRGNKWQLVHKGESALPFRDMIWYQDRVWCTSDYGLWHITDGKFSAASLPDGMNSYSGNLSAAAGVLLIAGYGGAAYLLNGVWTKIFSAVEMSRVG